MLIQIRPDSHYTDANMMTQPIDFRPGYMEFKDGGLVTTRRKLAEYKRKELAKAMW